MLGTLGAVATTTAATGTAAKSSASAFALYTSNVKTLEAAAAASTTKVAGLLRVVGSLAAIGGIVITVDLIVKGIGDVIAATREIMRLRGVRAGGGAAAQFAGASRETVVDAQKDQKKILAGIQRSQKANELNAGQKLAQTVLGALSPLVGLPTAGQQAQRAQLYKEQARFSQGVLGLDPMQFKETTPTTQDTNTSTGTGTGTGTGTKPPRAKKTPKPKDFTEEIANSKTALNLANLQSAAEGKILEARRLANEPLALALTAQKEIYTINADMARIKADKDMPNARKLNEIAALEVQSKDITRQLTYDIATAEQTAGQTRLQAITAYLEKQYELNTAIQQQKALAESISTTLGQGMTSVFDLLIQGSDNWGKSLQQIASKVLVDIANQLIRIYVIEQAVSAIKSFLSPALPFGGGGGQIGGVGTLGPNYGIKQFANGGVPPVGRPSLVGERGPELFMPGIRGTVIPNGGFGGSTSVVVNVDASGNSNVQGDQAQSRQLGIAVSAAVQAELVKQQRPGGLLSGTRR